MRLATGKDFRIEAANNEERASKNICFKGNGEVYDFDMDVIRFQLKQYGGKLKSGVVGYVRREWTEHEIECMENSAWVKQIEA